MLWILCLVIKEITVLCPRQGWTFPDSQPYTLKWNSLVPTLDSSSLIALCVRLISFLTTLIYDPLRAAFFFEILKGYWCTEAKHRTCQSVMMSETASPASALLPHLLPTCTWHGVATWLNLAPAATARPLSRPALLSCTSASEVKHVSGAWDEAREREMSQMNTCQVMSSPVSADDRPQLFRCSEAHSAAPVWRRFSSHNCSTEQARYSRGFHNSLVMKSTEVKRGRRYISNRARFHTASVAENML